MTELPPNLQPGFMQESAKTAPMPWIWAGAAALIAVALFLLVFLLARRKKKKAGKQGKNLMKIRKTKKISKARIRVAKNKASSLKEAARMKKHSRSSPGKRNRNKLRKTHGKR